MTNLASPIESVPKGSKVVLVTFVLMCVIGIISSWHLVEVFRQTHLDPEGFKSFCNISESMNCDRVALHDEFSVVLGSPVAVWAIAGYVFIALLSVLALFRAQSRFGQGFLFLFGLLLVAVSLWLVYVMHFKIGSWCIVCLAIDAVNLSLFGLSIAAIRLSTRTVAESIRSDFGALLRLPLQTAAMAVVGTGLLAAAWLGGQHLQSQIAQERASRQAAQRSGANSEDPQVLYVSRKDERLEEHKWSKKTQDNPEDENCDQGGKDAASPVISIRIGLSEEGYNWKGAEHPAIEIHEFTDFQCPYCRGAHMMVSKLLSRYPDRLRVYHRHLPLDHHCNSQIGRPFHPRACELSRIAVCAGRQGRFFETADYLFHNAETIRAQNTSTDEIAKALALDLGKFGCCMDDPQSMRPIESDLADAATLSLRGTPAFVINGQVYYGKIPDEALKALGTPEQ
ncbi:MAG: thioredoxin domain-containing protein [Myxococcota bacterium]|jgi:uncharacterized membrane protein/predicted DsbA family dithiol-disulfide isomerase|nr:thioredoxin domain-containing protein [Myxococcota bacterium]